MKDKSETADSRGEVIEGLIFAERTMMVFIPDVWLLRAPNVWRASGTWAPNYLRFRVMMKMDDRELDGGRSEKRSR